MFYFDGSAFLSHVNHRYAKTDGTHDIPDTPEGRLVRQAKDEIERLLTENGRYVEALEELARLGNGRLYGNSDGNIIAQKALQEASE